MAADNSPLKNHPSSRPIRPPASTPAVRENQMISLAVDLAEKQLADGTATTPIIVHYLKMATERERLEREKLMRENELLEMKAEAYASNKRMEVVYEKALEAMKEYSGNS